MQDLRTLFESEYPGKERLFDTLIKPIFSKAKDTSLTDEQVLLDADKKQIKSFSIIAQVRGGFPIVFADVELQDTVALKRSRVGIQKCVRKVMENDSNAIIFFHFTDNVKEWRVSYVHRAETNRNSTSAKRYTYLCGPEHACRTVSERFETLKGLATIKDEDMIEAFSVEPLSKDFFERYREQYADLVEYISGKRFVKKGGKFVEEKTKNASGSFKNAFDGDDKAVRDFVKKMMGRLVFLQFLQKKGWLGVKTGDEWGSGDKNFLENLFKNAGKDVQDDFLEQALELLFFKTLNTSRGDEAIAPEKLCEIYGSSIRIPYLNGGLFEEDELDKKKVKFKKEHFASLFEFFNQYNFTIDETDPDDTEIGVDPEMLGKIFENLLEDNKDKGAFYTPKEIVQYMCRESLIAYLSEKIPAEEKVRNFVLTHESSFTEKEKADILNALLEVKVCDPAVGSGAFPMGMLNELLACTQVLIGESKSRAELKKHIVKNNIYGVDIEKGAVDIARLRFWLAIIVDEEEPLPLPNLDYKIMQGNSLLECYMYKIGDGKDKGKEVTFDLSRMLEKPEDVSLDYTEEQRNLLKTNIDEYFGDNNHEDKRVKNDVIKSCVFDLACDTCGLKQNSENALALHEKIWNGTSDFFLWHTWFNDVFSRPQKQGGTKSGFDIVIGNPPYGAKTSDKEKELYKKYYEAAKTYKGISKGSTDTFAIFVNLGYNLLAKNGNLAFIIPMAVTSSDAMTTLHNLLEKNCATIKVSSYSNRPKQIFDAACIRTSVFFFTKTLTANEHIYTTKLQRRRYTDSIGAIIDGLVYIDSKELKLPGRYAKISLPVEKAILRKLFSAKNSIASCADEKGKPFYYRTSGGRYFNVISDAPTGSTQDKPYFVRKDLNSLVAAALSTSLFWFYCQVYTDGLHIKSTEIDTFPLPNLAQLPPLTTAAIKEKYAEYLADIEKNVVQHTTFKEYKLRKSKHLIDQLDDLICPLYGLTVKETEFIKNYEIEFRVED
ncbi:MAG: N-6 DNA methylase [Treponema sp.]|nr:N-6 DNA methylase [Treponema sp.]